MTEYQGVPPWARVLLAVLLKQPKQRLSAHSWSRPMEDAFAEADRWLSHNVKTYTATPEGCACAGVGMCVERIRQMLERYPLPSPDQSDRDAEMFHNGWQAAKADSANPKGWQSPPKIEPGEVVGTARIIGTELGVILSAERVPGLLKGEIMPVDLVYRGEDGQHNDSRQ